MGGDWSIERFSKSQHDRAGFDCGNAALNDFLRTKLNQQSRRDLTRGYVLCSATGKDVEKKRVFGYYTLSASLLELSVVGESAAGLGIPIPATRIGRFAVDRTVQGKGLGTLLFADALRRAVSAAEDVASTGIEVDAKDERAKRFYEKMGFTSLEDDAFHLFLPMKTVREVISKFDHPS